jgi:gamma-glutamyl:cysteine ligase YbdK (ATP-grasp superfamily)
MRNFMNRFNFRPEGSRLIGIEREVFLVDDRGNIAPLAEKALAYLGISDRFGYELSACQLEDRIGPCQLADLKESLLDNEAMISKAEKAVGFGRSFQEFAPETMPLDVYPDPAGRYQAIVRNMSQPVLLAACRVLGTHVHIGMPNHETALRVYNHVIGSCDDLCRMGDYSAGQRLSAYKVVAPNMQPPRYDGWSAFHQEAVQLGFEQSPRNCWHLIRLSIHGTIEFRVFGATDDLETVLSWAQSCHDLCSQAMDACSEAKSMAS